MDLYSFEVTDRKSFVQFLKLLHQDLLSNKDEWENATLERFLEAFSAYANDIQGYYNNKNQGINADLASWKVFADILKGTIAYE